MKTLLFAISALLLLGVAFAHEDDEPFCFPKEALDITSEYKKLWVNHQPFVLKGVNWFGFETPSNVIFGLNYRPLEEIVQFLKDNRFNFIRMPFYLELMLNDKIPDPSYIDVNINPELRNLTSLEIMDKVIGACEAKGILVMLDMHSFKPGTYLDDGLWYNADHPESMVLQTWDIVIERFHKKFWNLIAIDLKNEPHGVTWGSGNVDTDFNLAAERIGNHILANGGEKILIFVTGSHSSPPCPCFWGENYMNIYDHPVTLSNQKKLVYTPHTYGPNVFDGHAYFSDPTFPENMPAIWNQHFGFVPNVTGQAIVIGEWGGRAEGKQQQWNLKFADWLKETKTAHAFWCLNPESADTGGLFENDWRTPVTAKLDLLSDVTPDPTVFTPSEDGQICILN
jgi:endoglucanase